MWCFWSRVDHTTQQIPTHIPNDNKNVGNTKTKTLTVKKAHLDSWDTGNKELMEILSQSGILDLQLVYYFLLFKFINQSSKPFCYPLTSNVLEEHISEGCSQSTPSSECRRWWRSSSLQREGLGRSGHPFPWHWARWERMHKTSPQRCCQHPRSL